MDDDQTKGKVNELVGKGKQAAGDLADDESLKSQGEAQETQGEAQNAWGQVKDRVGNAAKDLTS